MALIINGTTLSNTATVTANGTEIKNIYACDTKADTCALVWHKPVNLSFTISASSYTSSVFDIYPEMAGCSLTDTSGCVGNNLSWSNEIVSIGGLDYYRGFSLAVGAAWPKGNMTINVTRPASEATLPISIKINEISSSSRISTLNTSYKLGTVCERVSSEYIYKATIPEITMQAGSVNEDVSQFRADVGCNKSCLYCRVDMDLIGDITTFSLYDGLIVSNEFSLHDDDVFNITVSSGGSSKTYTCTCSDLVTNGIVF